MPKQDPLINATSEQKDLLDLEKKYFSKLEEIVSSASFHNDLRSIETEIKLNYLKLSTIWNLKNKIKVAAERLVRHHIYMNLVSEIRGVYESPISSDFGVVLDDCILCVDCKTLDTKGNPNDINYTSIEPNQTSFDNSNHNYIKAQSNLDVRARLSRLPILTYIIKIIYRDDNVQFDISRTTNKGKKPSIVLTCIPNGILSSLFKKNIIKNFKTYKYFKTEDGIGYTPINIPSGTKDCEEWTEEYCIRKGYLKVSVPLARGSKNLYFDAAQNVYWTYTSDENKKMIRAVKYGDSMRLDNEILKDRYDSANNHWDGYTELDI